MGKTNAKLTPTSPVCLCRNCGEYFSGLYNFDAHRRGGVCKNPESIGLSIVTKKNGDSVWSDLTAIEKARKAFAKGVTKNA